MKNNSTIRLIMQTVIQNLRIIFQLLNQIKKVIIKIMALIFKLILKNYNNSQQLILDYNRIILCCFVNLKLLIRNKIN